MSTCPFCGTTYHSTYPPMELSKRQREVYNTVISAGERGITARSLVSAVYGSTPPRTAWGGLRVNVFEINRKLKLKKINLKIKGQRDIGYILTKADIDYTPVEDNGEE